MVGTCPWGVTEDLKVLHWLGREPWVTLGRVSLSPRGPGDIAMLPLRRPPCPSEGPQAPVGAHVCCVHTRACPGTMYRQAHVCRGVHPCTMHTTRHTPCTHGADAHNACTHSARVHTHAQPQRTPGIHPSSRSHTAITHPCLKTHMCAHMPGLGTHMHHTCSHPPDISEPHLCAHTQRAELCTPRAHRHDPPTSTHTQSTRKSMHVHQAHTHTCAHAHCTCAHTCNSHTYACTHPYTCNSVCACCMHHAHAHTPPCCLCAHPPAPP